MICYTAKQNKFKTTTACHLAVNISRVTVSCFLFDVIVFILEVKSDHRSKFSNLGNWKEEAWKMCGFIAQLVEHHTGIAEVTGSNPGVEALIFFRLLLSSCLNWKIYCDDHSSLPSTTAVQIWIISYKLQFSYCCPLMVFSCKQFHCWMPFDQWKGAL